MAAVKSFIKREYPIVGIMLLASCLKLYSVDSVLHDHNSDRFIFESLRIVENIDFFPSTSVGYVAMPIYLYLIAFALFLHKSLLSVVLFFTLLNILSIFVCYKIGKEFFSREAGIIASLLFAVFPYSVIALRGTLLNAYILPVFLSLFFYYLLALIYNKQPYAIFPTLLFLLLATQVHSLAVFFLPLLMIILLFAWTDKRKKYIFITLTVLFLALLLIVPLVKRNQLMLFFNAVTSSFAGEENSLFVSLIRSYFLLVKGCFTNLIDLFEFPLQGYNFSNDEFTFTMNDKMSLYDNTEIEGYLFEKVCYTELMLFVFGVLLLFFGVKRRGRRIDVRYFTLIIWFFYFLVAPGGVFADLVLNQSEESQFYDPAMDFNVRYRYMIPIFPLPFLVIGNFFSQTRKFLCSKVNGRGGRSFLWKGYVVFVIIFISFLVLPQIVLSIDFLHNSVLSTKAKPRIIASLIEDFGVADHSTYLRIVNFIGFGGSAHHFMDGFDAAFYLANKSNAGLEERNERHNIMVIDKSEMRYLEGVFEKVSILRLKDLKEYLIMEYDFPEERRCKDRCILARQTFKVRLSPDLDIAAELDKSSNTLWVNLHSEKESSIPEHLLLVYEHGNGGVEFVPCPKEGIVSIDLGQRVRQGERINSRLKEGVNILGIKPVGKLFRSSIMYMIFEVHDQP